jgi:hypothetical protein
MKRINPKTNAVFKHGEIREDGFCFGRYILSMIKKDGMFAEQWHSPESFEKLRLKKSEIKKSNRIKYNEYNKKWALYNSEKRLSLEAKRRASKLQRTPKWLSKEHFEEINDFYQIAKMFEIYTGQKYHVDHIEPLQGENVSGLHVPWNLQIMLAKDNLSKGNKRGL